MPDLKIDLGNNQAHLTAKSSAEQSRLASLLAFSLLNGVGLGLLSKRLLIHDRSLQ